MATIIIDYINDLVDTFLNPQKRVFIGYLGITLFFVLIFHSISAKVQIFDALKWIFSRNIWLSKSAKTDYKMLFINKVFLLFLSPILLSKLVLATLLFESFHIWFDGRIILIPNASSLQISTIFTFTLFLLDDLTKYLVHRALHSCSILWAFHRVHHSAEALTPFTVFRTHPVEAIIFSIRSTLVQAVAVAFFLYFFGSRAELLTVLGASVFLFIFNVAGSNLRHSHVWISYGNFLELLLISPAQHQIHHSTNIQHIDCNFGTILAIWDRLGGTLLRSKGEEDIQFGTGISKEKEHSLRSVYIHPFVDAGRSILHTKIKDKKIMQWSSKKFNPISLCLLITILISTFTTATAASELNIYSHRQPFLINPFIDTYSKISGIKVNIVYASKGLAQRLKAEGARSPADIILTVDIARLHVYADKNLLAPINSKILKKNIPVHLRDSKNRWFAFSKRARVIVAAKRATDTADIVSYEDLANPKWRGRICSRPGSHVYNRALIASLIHSRGAIATENWAKGLVQNLARRPQGNDRAQVKAIYEGQCDIAIINHYYFNKMKHSKNSAHQNWAKAVRLIFPNQKGRGTHINISGGGVAKYSKNKFEAQRFLEFLTSEIAQKLYATVNFEYPVNPKVSLSDELTLWGSFTEDQMPISRVAELAPKAQIIIDRVGW